MIEHLKNKWGYYLLGALILVFISFEARGEGDFSIFLAASRDLWGGKNVYTIMYQQWYHYYYGVFFAILLTPLNYVSLYLAKFLWLLLNTFFVYRTWKILSSWLPLEKLSKKALAVFTVLCFVFIFRFLRDNFHLSQLTICILYLTLEGLFFIEKDKKVAGAALIALGIDIKLLPIIIIPYLIYRKEWKATIFVVAFILVFLFIPTLFIGYDFNILLLTERWNLLNPSNAAHVLDTSERSFHSLTTLLATLLVENTGDANHVLHIKRNIADISIEKLNMIINICRGILVLGTFWFLRTLPFRSATSKLHKLYEVSYLCLVVPLIFPHQQHYAFFFAFPAGTYLLFYLVYKYYNTGTTYVGTGFKSKRIVLSSLLFIVFILSSSHLLLGTFNEYYDHFKTLTYGMLLLLVTLVFCEPNKLNQ
ncbi:MAG TPA: glycosyltransferase family 87 protein [Bacteroidia bacterium]